MWLDRFSGHSTPSGSPPPPQNRSSFQNPRRPSHLAPGLAARPSYSPRSSSFSSASKLNSSTTSLASTSRLTNGSTLRHEITPPIDLKDPLRALAEIVGRSLHPESDEISIQDGDGGLDRPTQLAEDIDFGELSLQEFIEADAIDEQGSDVLIETSSIQTVQEYDKEKDKFEDLHRSILACDEVLKSVEVSLTSFQKDLGAVSAEIETLQNRSIALNTKLENRRIVEKLLLPAVEELSIAPAIVLKISEDPIDQEWVKALEELERRTKVVNSKLHGPDQIVAITDIKPLLDDLTNKALERLRDYFVSQIKALRSPNVNAQIIQQQNFLKFKDLYAFMARNHPQLAEEIGQAYINTMHWYYLSAFTRYRQSLEKLPLYVVEKTDVLGADSTNSLRTKSHYDALTLGRRNDVLTRQSSNAIPAHLTSEFPNPTNLETPFHSFNLALVDNASSEYSFLTSFFPIGTAFTSIATKFLAIFDQVFALGHAYIRFLIENTYDCLGVLLCVRLNQHFAFELQRRKIPVADGYINGTNMLLWPRFQLAMDAHCESIRRVTAALPGRSTTSALSLTSNSNDAARSSAAPHVLAQRFGQFLQGILVLSTEAGDDEPVGSSLGRLRGEVEAFLAKMAKGIGGAGAGVKEKRERFLSNNWSLILTIIGDCTGRLASEMKAHFETLKARGNIL